MHLAGQTDAGNLPRRHAKSPDASDSRAPPILGVLLGPERFWRVQRVFGCRAGADGAVGVDQNCFDAGRADVDAQDVFHFIYCAGVISTCALVQDSLFTPSNMTWESTVVRRSAKTGRQ